MLTKSVIDDLKKEDYAHTGVHFNSSNSWALIVKCETKSE